MSKSIRMRHNITSILARVSVLNDAIVAAQADIVAKGLTFDASITQRDSINRKAGQITALLQEVRTLNAASVSAGGMP